MDKRQTPEEVAAFLGFDMKTKKAIHDAVQDAQDWHTPRSTLDSVIDSMTPERPRIAGHDMRFTGNALADRLGWCVVKRSDE